MPGDRRDSKEMNRLLVRVLAEVNQGGRKEMEDFTSIVFEHNPEQSFFAVFDGHGRRDAAIFAKNRLWATVKKQKGFHSNDDLQVVKAIKKSFMETHRCRSNSVTCRLMGRSIYTPNPPYGRADSYPLRLSLQIPTPQWKDEKSTDSYGSFKKINWFLRVIFRNRLIPTGRLKNQLIPTGHLKKNQLIPTGHLKKSTDSNRSF